MTPEGKVKKAVKELLNKYGDDLYQYWPVPTGYGASSLDCIGCFRGKFFAIETKAPGKKPTRRQQVCIDTIKASGGMVFVIDDSWIDDTTPLSRWLEYVHSTF